ncbi:hypothetical protein [Cereibacter sphaeroides]|uniref:hypothetical protein n=1 Tax=Cereibacter sphaeroides TaxID=1063 RepID=UPI001F40E119|nr:hypothetical protein [Cereibacter sphaeroides]
MAADAGAMSLRVHLDRAEAAASVAALLARAQGRARAPVRICVRDPSGGQEIDIELGQDFAVSPQIRSALRAVPGVEMVEEI